jgi:CHAT domain-containing protein/Flp pilus assembly protein TadD
VHRRLHRFSLVTATLLLSLTSTIKLPKTPLGISAASAQAQTSQDRNAEALRLIQAGLQHLDRGQFREALQTFEKVLGIVRVIGERQGEALTLTSIGSVYNELGQYADALKYLEQALVIAKQVGNKTIEETTLNKIGLVYGNLGQYADALRYLEQALVIAKQVGNKAGEGANLSGIGFVYGKLGQYADALKYHEQALVIAKQVGNKAGEGASFNNIGGIYYRLGQYTDALRYLEQALVIDKEIGNKASEGTTLGNIGEVYRSLGQYTDALRYLEQALVIAQQVGNKAGEAATLNHMGGVYKSLGQYADALRSLEQALVIDKEIGNRAGEGTTLNNIGRVYNSLGQYANALKYLEQALVIYQQVGNKAWEGAALSNIGLVYGNLGQYTDALRSLEQALVIAQQMGDKATEGATLHHMGGVYESLGQYADALKSYEQALVIVKEIGDKAGEGATLDNIGLVYHRLGQYADALKFYKQALVIVKEIGDKTGERATLNNIGGVYNSLGQYADAEKTLFAAIEVLESLRPGLTDADKISIFDTQASTYRLLQQALVAQNKTNTALEIAERGRARAFVELLAEKLSSNVRVQGVAPQQPPINPLKIEQIQQISREQNATLVEYSIVYSELYIWVVNPNGEVAFKQVDLKSLNTPLTDLVTNSREAIGARGRSIFKVTKPPAPDQTQRLQQLHNLLIEPIAQFLPTNPIDRVIFIPQNELFLVPFPALKDASGKYLIEKHTILTAPGIQVLELTRKQRQQVAGKDVLVVGNPTMPSISPKIGERPQKLASLPSAEREAEAIAQLLNTKAITGNQATKTTVTQQMEKARIIHLATHGLLDDFKGLGVPGAIALAPSANDNGLLTSSEILDLKLNAELVVLSACDTGRGTITGDGVIGLSRSLISAGVPSIIVSLWSVPDAPTASLMTEFYRQLPQNPDKATALRQAMLTTMKQHPNPKDWAAFTLIGEAE